MKRYLTFWLTLTAVLLALAAGVNLIVDPYELFRIFEWPSLNRIKPRAGTHGPMVKAYQVLRVRPRALLLGNSRVEIGFDPTAAVWAPDLRPVYDLALPGTGTHTSLMYLRHVLEHQKAQPPKVVVWGIDFMDFLVDAKRFTRKPRDGINPEAARLLANADGSLNPSRPLQVAKDYATSIFTLAALSDSIATIIAQHRDYPEDLTPLGHNPMRDFIKIVADEGPWAVFRQKDLSSLQVFLMRPADVYAAGSASSPPLDDLRQAISLCQTHNIRLYLAIPPYHARQLETFRITGHWQAFENWKRAVLHAAYDELIARGFAPVPLWDFSQFNPYTEEAIPPKETRNATMKWWWDSTHFKREFGDLVLARILAYIGRPPGYAGEAVKV